MSFSPIATQALRGIGQALDLVFRRM